MSAIQPAVRVASAAARSAGSVYAAGTAGMNLATGAVEDLKKFQGKVGLVVNVASL